LSACLVATLTMTLALNIYEEKNTYKVTEYVILAQSTLYYHRVRYTNTEYVILSQSTLY